MKYSTDTAELIRQASTLVDSGQGLQALALYRQVIELDPSNAEAWLMQGAIMGETGDIQAAEASIRKALSINPEYADAYMTLGSLQLATGRQADALSSLQAAVSAQPAAPDAHFQLAGMLAKMKNYPEACLHALKAAEYDPEYTEAWQLAGWLQYQSGEFEEAERSYTAALKLSPGDADLHGSLGILLASTGKYPQAIKHLEKHLQAHPDDSNALNTLGVALISTGDIESATTQLRKALSLEPSHTDANINMGIVLQYAGRIEEAKAHLETAMYENPDRADLQYQLAGVLSALGEYEAALEHCQRATQIDPQHENAIAGQADIYQKQGKYADAMALIKPLLATRPVNIQAAIIHSQISKHIETDIDSIEMLEDAAQQQQLALQDQPQFYTALGKLYDQAGNYEQAFECFRKSNLAKQSSYDPEAHQQFIDEIIDGFASTIPSAATAEAYAAPIFIIGMPRSGTTLIEQILASHPQVHGSGEFLAVTNLLKQPFSGLPPYPRYLRSITGALVNKLARELRENIYSLALADSKVIINERPSYLYLGLLARLFPQAKFIHCTRDPLDTCLSCYFQLLTSMHDYSYDLEHLGQHYTQYRRLMQHWVHLGIPMHTIHYEDIVSAQEETTRKLLEYCVLPWSDNCLNFHKTERKIVTPSYDDVRQPIYSSSVSRWRNYEQYIDRLRTSLGETLQESGQPRTTALGKYNS